MSAQPRDRLCCAATVLRLGRRLMDAVDLGHDELSREAVCGCGRTVVMSVKIGGLEP